MTRRDELVRHVAAAILDAQLRGFERRRLDTPDEIKAAAVRAVEALIAQENAASMTPVKDRGMHE